MTLSAPALSSWRTERFAAMMPILTPFLLFAVIGIELMTLASWLPDTLRIWWSPEVGKLGDFEFFYSKAESPATLNQYSPGLILLMKPLAALDLLTAFQVYFAINAAALLGVAYLAQRAVQSPAAKLAVFLGVIALPHAHWALRVGHFVPVLALLALSGFLLAERRPLVAGMCFALLALKPQYLPIPMLYLLWTRNWRALTAAAGTLIVITGAGIVTVGTDSFMAQLERLTNTGLDHGERYLPIQQAWQYSWQGFLVSAGINPNPLVTADLLLLSLGAVVLVWFTRARSVAKVAAAVGMLLLAPYSTFYNWTLIVVAAALLLRADVRPRFLIPMILAVGSVAAAATLKATPYPVSNVLTTVGPGGLYWIQPFALGTVFLLAFVGARRRLGQAEEPPEEAAPAEHRIRWSLPKIPLGPVAERVPVPVVWTVMAVVAVSSGYVVSAFVSQNGPFQPGHFGRQTVLAALPEDFPVPPEATIEDAGRGTVLPYRIEWQSGEPVSEVAGALRTKLADGTWEIVLEEGEEDDVLLRTARLDLAGFMDVFAEVRVIDWQGGSAVSLEFTPLPTDRVPGFEDWLEDKEENQRAIQ
jgi:hypothetical protein